MSSMSRVTLGSGFSISVDTNICGTVSLFGAQQSQILKMNEPFVQFLVGIDKRCLFRHHHGAACRRSWTGAKPEISWGAATLAQKMSKKLRHATQEDTDCSRYLSTGSVSVSARHSTPCNGALLHILAFVMSGCKKQA